MSKDQLIASNLGKSYNNRKVVRDVSFKVKKGEVVGLLGPNGAGKTTSFYMVAGIIKQDHGKIVLNDIDISYEPMYKRARLGISYLPQESSIFRGLNVADNILAVLQCVYTDKEKIKYRLEELLAEFSISHLSQANAMTLSGGERRRLEIARCLAINPQYLLLDEPLAGIDPIAINDLKEIILQLKKKFIGVLITDHNVRDALTVIDKAYIIHEGRVLIYGNPKDIINNKEVRKIYLGQNFVPIK